MRRSKQHQHDIKSNQISKQNEQKGRKPVFTLRKIKDKIRIVTFLYIDQSA